MNQYSDMELLRELLRRNSFFCPSIMEWDNPSEWSFHNAPEKIRLCGDHKEIPIKIGKDYLCNILISIAALKALEGELEKEKQKTEFKNQVKDALFEIVRSSKWRVKVSDDITKWCIKTTGKLEEKLDEIQ